MTEHEPLQLESERAKELAGIGCWYVDTATGAAEVSGSWYGILGLEPKPAPPAFEEFLGLVRPDDQPNVERLYRQLRGGAVDAVSVEFRISKAVNGEERSIFAVAEAVRKAGGAVQAVRGCIQDITELRSMEEELRQLIEYSPDGILMVDGRGLIQRANAQAERLFGYPRSELLQQPVEMLIPEPSREAHVRYRAQYLRAPRLRPMGEGKTLWARCRDGTLLPVEISLNHYRTGRGLQIVASVRDVSKQREMEAALQQSELRFRGAFEHTAVAMAILSADGRCIKVNRALCQLFGASTETLLQMHWQQLLEASDGVALETEIGRLTEGSAESVAVESRYLKQDGGLLWGLLSLSAVRDESGAVLYLVAHLQDVTEEHRLTEQLSYQATHDALTGFVNRWEFERRLEQLLQDARVNGGGHVLAYLDLDQFKVVNDTCGHHAGDELLREVAPLFSNGIRRGDTIARLGGDEFAVLLEGCSLKQGHRVASGLLRAVADFRFQWEDKRFAVGVSIGLVPVRSDSGTVGNILSRADAACYAAKDAGRNRVHVYDESDRALALQQGEMQWVEKVNRALDENRFELWYQPIQALAAGRGWHYGELLLRLQDRDGTLVAPGRFLPACERYGLASRIDHWVVAQALQWLSGAPERRRRGRLYGINLSGQSIGDAGFLESVLRLLQQSEVPPELICFEITETAAVRNLAMARDFILTLKKIGCLFALDDFGSGLSSFGYLKTLPVDILKIDGIFVKDMIEDEVDAAMVKSINEIGHVMDKCTVAEFVENDALYRAVRHIGVDYAQGYGVGRPMPLTALDRRSTG